jgi:large subunit ribosomal protein L24e
MVERRVCTFCGDEIEPGTGKMYIKKDGVVYNFCTSKCFKNMVILHRLPRRTTWTQYYAREKQIRMKGAPEAVIEAPKARKVKKAEGKEETKAPAKGEKLKTEEKKPAQKEPAKKAPVKKPEAAKTEKPKPKPEQKDKAAEGGKA